ncbi:MAG: methionine--tRNA ligase, partial [Geobacter sp.]
NKYFNGILPAAEELTETDQAYRAKTEALPAFVDAHLDDLAFSKALQAIWEVISAGNKYIDETAPWSLAKDPAQHGRLATVMYCMLESQRIVFHLLSPFMPETAVKGLRYLGWQEPITEAGLTWGGLRPETRVIKAEALFPRIEEKGDV